MISQPPNSPVSCNKRFLASSCCFYKSLNSEVFFPDSLKCQVLNCTSSSLLVHRDLAIFFCFHTCFNFFGFHTTAHVAFSKVHNLLLQVNTEFLHKIPDTPNTAYFISHATVLISSQNPTPCSFTHSIFVPLYPYCKTSLRLILF